MSSVQAGDKVALKDKDGGFTDPVTGFDISRDQELELTDPIGTRTHQALMTGGLLVVGSRGEKAVEEPAEKAADEEVAEEIVPQQSKGKSK